MNIKTIGDERKKKYEYYIKQPIEKVELNLNMIIAKNPHLMKSLDRSTNQPLIIKYSNIPLNIQ